MCSAGSQDTPSDSASRAKISAFPRVRAVASAALRIQSVISGYRGGPAVLRGVDVELGPGELITVRGRNGSGKTTLLKVAAGLLRPRSGQAQRKGDVGYMPQTGAERKPRGVGDHFR